MNPPNGQVKAVGRGRTPWRADQNTELRRPQGVPSTPSEASSSDNESSKDDVSDVLALALKSNLSVNAKEFRSNLSVNAKEFVPKFASPTVPTYSQNYEDYGQAEEESDISLDEWIMSYLNDVIKQLTCDPGKFDRLSKPLLEDISSMLSIEEIVENAVMLIIDQAIAERNFRYSGARLCKLFSKVPVERIPGEGSGETSIFRRVLLTKLNEEHDKIESNLGSRPDQVYGFIQFLAELYIQLEIDNTGQRIGILGDGLLMALKILIRMPSVDNIKNTCDILKLTGRMLDADQPDSMDSFFADLQKLLDDERMPTRAKNILSNILKFRSEMWGHAVSTESIPSALAASEQQLSDGVYYGPDHIALTAEEFKFLNASCEPEETVPVVDDSTVWDPNMNDDENAEIMAAFNEFLNHK